jgi:hypothetical protein
MRHPTAPNELVAALIRTKRVPGRLTPQYKLMTLNEDGIAGLSSSIDFVLTIGDQEDVYLACECKRLNVPLGSGVRSLAAEYVDEGLMRFVKSQYSAGLPLAMMLGYVMDDRLAVAWRNLRRTLGKKASTTNLLATREANPQIDGRFRFASSHKCNSGCEIEISHTLLAWA